MSMSNWFTRLEDISETEADCVVARMHSQRGVCLNILAINMTQYGRRKCGHGYGYGHGWSRVIDSRLCLP